MDNNSKIEQYEFDGAGLTTSEKHKAKKLFEDYKHDYHIENLSDLQLLSDLVFREILQVRNKKIIGKLAKNKKNKEDHTVPTHLLKALDENLDKIMLIKEKLGLFEQEEKQDTYSYIEKLKIKFALWRKNNWDARKLTCPWCSKIFFLKIRTDKYDAVKSPFFVNRVISNKPLMDLYHKKKLTKEEVASVLGVSPDYVDWLEEKFPDTPSK